MRVLFLDDMASRQKLFKQASIGYIVDFASTAREAIDLLKKNEYDLIYLDHDLEAEHYQRDTTEDDEDGCFVARAMRKLTQHHGKTVIVHSMNESGRKNIKSLLKDLYTVYLGPEDFKQAEMWKIDLKIVLQVLGLEELPTAEVEGG